jgi:hypothetical protein
VERKRMEKETKKSDSKLDSTGYVAPWYDPPYLSIHSATGGPLVHGPILLKIIRSYFFARLYFPQFGFVTLYADLNFNL